MTSYHRRVLQVVKQTADANCSFAPVGDNACNRCGGCTSGLMNGASVSSEIILPYSLLKKQNLPPLKIGQSLDAMVPATMLLALSSLVYLLPVVLMLFFSVSCDLLLDASEAQIAGSAVVGLCLGLGSVVFFGPALRSLIYTRLILSSGSTDSNQQ